MLPCDIVIQETEDGAVEMAAIDPAASMAAVDNPVLEEIAAAIGAKLHAVIAEV